MVEPLQFPNSLVICLGRKKFDKKADKLSNATIKRVVSDKNIGPIIKIEMTRCIHCTRCVCFACEIAWVGNRGIFGRGINSEIGTYVTNIFDLELSGNVSIYALLEP